MDTRDGTKKILYIAMSLDGYIATRSGGLEWLVEDPSYDFYDSFIENIGSIIMGRNTYEKILSFDIDWPYGDIPCFIMTHNEDLDTIAGNRYENIKFTSTDAKELVYKICSSIEKDIWIMGGGEIVREFFISGLIDDLIIGIMPVLLGDGIPLFRKCFGETGLELLNVKSYQKGMVQLHYRVIHEQ